MEILVLAALLPGRFPPAPVLVTDEQVGERK